MGWGGVEMMMEGIQIHKSELLNNREQDTISHDTLKILIQNKHTPM